MPLITSERQAVEILANRIRKDGDEGLQNFARLVLGAHTTQAKMLASRADQVVRGMDIDDFGWQPDGNTVQVTREVDGKELNITLKADRLPITTYEELVEFYSIDTAVWKPSSQVFNFWGNEANPNFQVKAKFQRDEYQAASAEDREAFREWASQYAPTLNVPWLGSETGKMLEVVISDLHADKAGGLEDALHEMVAAVSDICGKAAALYNTVDEVNLVLLGDTFNSDSGKDLTTAGTPQNSEHTWRESFRQVREAVATAAITAAAHARRVRIHVLPGNHDYERSYYLADSLWAFFRNTEGIQVELNDSSRRYLEWGNAIIGLTHGDRIKPADLAMTMFREAETSGKQFLEWHLGHIHTRREDEVHGVTFQWFRSPQAAVGEWEHKNLFNHNRRDVAGIVWDEVNGPEDTFRYTVRSDS